MSASMTEYERAERLYGAAVEEFRALVISEATALDVPFPRGSYASIVVKNAEILQHRAERVSHETGVPVRILHALHLLRVRVR